jgi:ubiquinone biosynthesis UbiH/UbiF/VisC/COQ6 family hydroxylase
MTRAETIAAAEAYVDNVEKNASARFDVVIVGAGPAGLSFARSLAGTGLKIAVVEKLPAEVLASPPADGRDIALTHFSVRLLKELDAWRRFPTDSVSMIREARVLNGTSSYFLHFDHRETNTEALGYLVSNHLIRKALYEALAGFSNVTLITGVEVVSVYTDSAAASVRLSGGQALQASLAVAADSRFSTIRRHVGIAASMRDFGRVAMVFQMEHDLPHDDIAYECFLYKQTLAVLPLSGNRSSIVITLPAVASEAVLKMDETAFNRDVQNRFASRLGEMKLVGKRYSYPLVAVYADRFAATRFALIGDAAVGMHPVTAHGFNLGLRGQNTLSREIRSALDQQIDIGTPIVLERYQARHRRASLPLYLATNAIAKLYTDEVLPAKILRSAVLRLGNLVRPARLAIMRQLTESHL